MPILRKSAEYNIRGSRHVTFGQLFRKRGGSVQERDILPAACPCLREVLPCSAELYPCTPDIFSDYAYFSSYSESWLQQLSEFVQASANSGPEIQDHRDRKQRRLPSAVLQGDGPYCLALSLQTLRYAVKGIPTIVDFGTRLARSLVSKPGSGFGYWKQCIGPCS